MAPWGEEVGGKGGGGALQVRLGGGFGGALEKGRMEYHGKCLCLSFHTCPYMSTPAPALVPHTCPHHPHQSHLCEAEVRRHEGLPLMEDRQLPATPALVPHTLHTPHIYTLSTPV